MPQWTWTQTFLVTWNKFFFKMVINSSQCNPRGYNLNIPLPRWGNRDLDYLNSFHAKQLRDTQHRKNCRQNQHVARIRGYHNPPSSHGLHCCLWTAFGWEHLNFAEILSNSRNQQNQHLMILENAHSVGIAFVSYHLCVLSSLAYQWLFNHSFFVIQLYFRLLFIWSLLSFRYRFLC